MEPSPWKAVSLSAAQEFPKILWSLKIQYGVHKSLPLVSVLSQVNTLLSSHPVSLRSTLILSSSVRLGLLSGLFPSDFPTKILYEFFSQCVLYVLPISYSSTYVTNCCYFSKFDRNFMDTLYLSSHFGFEGDNFIGARNIHFIPSKLLLEISSFFI
jgi:hypothetical protein